ncbi:Arm DNA-binding domain-containing protein [Thiomicrorhabdus indica]|uniref:Arm DNA-binding domain-containing protein n=1 Tax=Thiomicrorhabdus indica TaxID=2267253 RepID=UPI00102DDA0D|nr:Arm DNA-binding domain-containing protein [Thiomicrorhabdus indica]
MLTDTKIKNLKPKENPYREADGGGLYLLVDPSGSKRWQFRFTWEESGKKKRPWQSIGAYPAVSLKDARSAVLESKELLASGINPIQHHKEVKQAKQDAVYFVSGEDLFVTYCNNRRELVHVGQFLTN